MTKYNILVWLVVLALIILYIHNCQYWFVIIVTRGSYIFGLYVKDIAQAKIETMTDLLKPATVEIFFAAFRPPTTMKIHNSDLEIMKCLLSDARMPLENIAEETSLSPRTVARRIEKMRENHVLLFTISRNLSSTRLTGYMEFDVLINVEIPRHQSILKKIYRELEEYLILFQIGITKKLLSQYFFVQTFLQPS